MAAATRYLCRGFRQISRNVPAKRKPIPYQSQPSIRPFSITTAKCAGKNSRPRPIQDKDQDGNKGEVNDLWEDFMRDGPSNGPELQEHEFLTPSKPIEPSDLDPETRAWFDQQSREDQRKHMRAENHARALIESLEGDDSFDALVDQVDRDIDREGGPDLSLDFSTTRATRGPSVGFWADDEDDEMGQMEDDDDTWEEENITTVAESELDLHRDIRHYTRMAAWDLPLLQQYAKPFQPPNHATPLRFRYTTYMGETHPAQHKVVVQLVTRDLLQNPNPAYKLSEAQRMKLLKLAGVRYNPSNDVIKMSCEKFGSAAQNKRYLGELVGSLIKEAKDKRDMFEDVPLDFRHHKQVNRPVYPESWKLKSETVKKVLEGREEMRLLAPAEDEVPIDGKILVESYVRAGNARASAALPQ